MSAISPNLPPESAHFHHAGHLKPGTPPRLPRRFVPREMLWGILEEAAASPVTMLVAPAGAGKTLGVAGWIRQRHSTMDDGTDSPDAIWIDGGPTWEPDRLARLMGGAPISSSREVAVPAPKLSLLKPAADLQPRLIVIDDAQKLPSSTIRFIDHQLNHDPESLRLLLLSRWDLLQTSLVSTLLGDLTIVRGDALRLADDEASALIEYHAGKLEPAVTSEIRIGADGWCAAVVLAARGVGAAHDPMKAARNFALGENQFVDRVANEVLAALPRRERHLLLCVAGEARVTAGTAAHLSRDVEAPQLLADMAADGLLVTRVSAPELAVAVASELPSDGDDTWYRIHPLLREVVRRRMMIGGVDVEQARGTVARAVHLDLGRGQAHMAFQRFVSIHRTDEAAEVLATTGLEMVACGQGKSIFTFVRVCADQVNTHPHTWLPIAVERWSVGDVEGARHWLDRMFRSRSELDDLELACAELMQVRLTRKQLDSAVQTAEDLITRLPRTAAGKSVRSTAQLAFLLIELGAIQNWLGDLEGAERNLSACVGLCRSAPRLQSLTTTATSHLALTQFMMGREHTAAQLAAEILSECPRIDGFAHVRAVLVRDLASIADIPRDQVLTPERQSQRSFHPADLCGRFWQRVLEARSCVPEGGPSASEQVLELPFDLPVADELPLHLRAALLLERGCLAVLTGNGARMKMAETDLANLGLVNESVLMAAFRADLAGDQHAALEAFERATASREAATNSTRVLAMVCAAQLLDARGECEEALERMRSAAAETATRRNWLAFLGMCRHGTPMPILLEALRKRDSTPWVHELAEAMANRADLTAMTASVTASPRERAEATPPPLRPALSTRERDVLRELSRGATYADIGGELFLSENTVKTHVSSLYAKLGASRRSEALSVARGLHLL